VSTTEPDPDALALLADAVVRLPDTVLEEALYAALGTAIKQRRDVVTVDRKQHMAAIHATSLDIKLPDGTKLASVSAPGSTDVAKVTNQGLFVRWVAEHFPAEIMQAVRPAWEKKFLGGLREGETGAEWADDTGEIHEVPGVEFETVEGRSSLRFISGGHELLAAAYRAGLLDHLNLPPILAIGPGPSADTAA
jgi:hypothetical protein